MKLDRLIGIITELQQKKSVTAPYLAEKFEVSRRTINRDIDDISKAGIPIVTTQGSGGGIAIMNGFNLNTTVFTKDELSMIFTGLKSLGSVSKTAKLERLASKFGGDNAVTLSDDMMIDLSSFYKDDLANKIERLKSAIHERRYVNFRYYYNKGEADKHIEPYLIVFKWSDWYIFGYCTERQDFRMYKLRRLWELHVCDETFEMRDIPEEKMQFGSNMTDDYYITAIYEPSEKYRLVEKNGPNSFTIMEDGRLLARWGFADSTRTLEWFLSFGDKVEVIDPPEMVDMIKTALEKVIEKYKRT